MNLERYEGVKAGEMIRVLRKLGYKQVGKPGKVSRFFINDEGDHLSTPIDPDEEMFPKTVWWMLNLMRLPDKEFERLRKEP